MGMIQFNIPGTPVGKGRPRFTGRGKAYTPKTTRNYEKLVQNCFHYTKCRAVVRENTPVMMTLTAFFPMPRSWSKKKRSKMDGRPCLKVPDMDNIEKAVCDALNGVAYPDDKQIFRINAAKYWTDGEGYLAVTLEWDEGVEAD